MHYKLNKTSTTIIYIIFLIVFQEIVFRYFFPIPEIKNFDSINFSYLYLNGNGSKHSRDLTRSWESQPDTAFTFKHYNNQYGFRDSNWFVSKKENKKRALFIGDSFIEGIMSTQSKTIPKCFELASNGKFETMNAGLVGCGLDTYLQLAADLIPLFKPDIAFLCIYANDLGENKPIIPIFFLEPEYFNLYKPRLIEIKDQINTYGPLNFRWNTNVTPYLFPVPNSINPWTENEHELKKYVAPWLAEKMKKATFNPFLTNSLFKEEKYLKMKPPIGEAIHFFKYVCEKNNTKPIVIYIPSRNQVTDYYLPFEKQYCILKNLENISLTGDEYQLHQRELNKLCKLLNVKYIDLTKTLKLQEAKGNHLYWNYDQHMRPKGYAYLGKTIWEELN